MTEWVVRNFDEAVLEKLELSPKDRAAFRALLMGKVIRKLHEADSGAEVTARSDKRGPLPRPLPSGEASP
jgi:hypothetical protein